MEQIELIHNFGKKPKFLFMYGNIDYYNGSLTETGLKIMGLTLTSSSSGYDWWYGGGYFMGNYGSTGNYRVAVLANPNVGNEKVSYTLIQLTSTSSTAGYTGCLVGGVTYHWFIVG